MERLKQEMLQIRDKLGLKMDLSAFLDKMRRDPKHYFPNTPTGHAAYLNLARGYSEFINKKIPEYFRLVPTTPF